MTNPSSVELVSCLSSYLSNYITTSSTPGTTTPMAGYGYQQRFDSAGTKEQLEEEEFKNTEF